MPPSTATMLDDASLPGWPQRLRAAAGYMGAACWGGAGGTEFARHHRRQALALFTLLLAIVFVFVAGALLLSVTMVMARETYERWHLEARLLGTCRKLLLVWGVFWLFALGMALRGGAWDLPLVGRIARRDNWVARSAWAARFAQVAVIATALAAAHALSLVRKDPAPGAAYFLYHDTGTFPRWFFALGFYPMAIATAGRLGPGHAVMQPLTKDTALHALADGRFVFFAAHGIRSGLLMSEEGMLRPDDVAAAAVNPAIEFVYLSGCDSGAQRDAWATALAPAELVTFDRLTPAIEHLAWMWLRGPARIRALRAPADQAPGR